ncbi:MAG: hypothetical protein IJ190_12190 [Prevotella sp.]|nr:hypothetical protein [Prevotella sp.]
MKKTYINPEMEVVELKANQPLLVDSLGFGDPTDQVDSRELDELDFLLDLQ